MIGSSNGEQYETEYDYLIGRPIGASTEPADVLKSSGGTLDTPGNIDLTQRPVVPNPDGSFSTVRSMSFNEDGKEVLVPTVHPEGRIMTNEEAIKHYRDTGQHLGKFDTVEAADTYAQQLHIDQEKLYQQKIDELVAAAPNFANSRVFDVMRSSAEQGRMITHEENFSAPITGEASKATLGPRSSLEWKKYAAMSQDLTDQGGADTINARPVDPSAGNFDERFGDWPGTPRPVDVEMNKLFKEDSLKGIMVRPGTKTKRGTVI